MQERLLTSPQAAFILGINETALSALVQRGLPCKGNAFSPSALSRWLAAPRMNDKEYLERFHRRLKSQYPERMAELKKFNAKFAGKPAPKGYSLHKQQSKGGHTWYVRYVVGGSVLPTRYSTHTGDRLLAERFAIDNRERLLEAYHRKHSAKKTGPNLYEVMKNYYAKDSPYLEVDRKRGRSIAESTRNTYHQFMLNRWVPYLRRQKVKSVEEIDPPFLARFQNKCLSQDDKPQTVNHYTSHLSMVFDHLLAEGYIKSNPCAGLPAIRVGEKDVKIRGCVETKAAKGAFSKKWGDSLNRLLCLMSYTTGMRNSEIARLKLSDVVEIGGVKFINISESKTRNGIRMVPLHDFAWRKLSLYAKGRDGPVFGRLQSARCAAACRELCGKIGYSEEKAQAEGITFYSGRHFWKTLMNQNNLGDAEEYFMGHKVSSDVAKRYNHRDKQGQQALVKKAREVFSVLDKCVFAG